MKETKGKIVDANGRIIESNRKNVLINYIEKNNLNFWGILIAILNVIIGGIKLIISKRYAELCSEYYGIGKQYFGETEIFEDKMILIFSVFILFIYPFLIRYTNKEFKSKIYVIFTFIAVTIVLFYQNLLYTIVLLKYIPWKWLEGFIDNYIAIIFFLIVDIIIAYFLIIKDFFSPKKIYNKIEKNIFSIALFIYLVDACMGVLLALSADVSDKKDYELISENKVIVTEYEGMFLVMDCDVIEENLNIKRGKYSFIEMKDVIISYYVFDDVICE